MEILLIASAATAAVGTIAQGSQQRAAYQAQANANQYNAAVLRQRADTAYATYGQREDHQRRLVRFEAGRRAAMAGESGFEPTGSIQDVESQAQALAELDALNIRYEGDLAARGLLAQSTLEEYGGRNAGSMGSFVRGVSYLGAGGDLLSGAGNYMRYRSGK